MSARRGVSKDLRVLLSRVEAAGGTVKPCRRSSHWKVYNAEGRYVTTICGTPSDWRSWRNDIANLRRAGIKV